MIFPVRHQCFLSLKGENWQFRGHRLEEWRVCLCIRVIFKRGSSFRAGTAWADVTWRSVPGVITVPTDDGSGGDGERLLEIALESEACPP